MVGLKIVAPQDLKSWQQNILLNPYRRLQYS